MKRLFTLSALLLFFAYPLCAQGGRSGAIVKAGKAALSHKPILELPKIQTHTHFTLSNGITTSVVPNLSNVTAAPTAGLTATTLSNLPGAAAAKPTVAPQGPSFRNRQMERFAAPISPEQSARITKMLDLRVINSGIRFEQIRRENPINQKFLFAYDPAYIDVALTGDLSDTPQDMYSDVPFLQDQEQLKLYFLARHNRENAKWYPKLYNRYQEITRRVDDFEKAKIQNASSIHLPDDISYLLLGDTHNFSGIMLQVASLLEFIQQQQPERKIIVLTEFIEEMKKWDPSIYLPGPNINYKGLWAKLDKRGIEVYGLEPKYVMNNLTQIFKFTSSEKMRTFPAFATIEAIRLRNARWLKTIEHFRKQYPDALIAVYAGATHVEYSQPYSLGDALAGQKTRVISFFPASGINIETNERVRTEFDDLTGLRFIDERILQFNDPELTKLFGADALLRTPPFAPKEDTEIPMPPAN